MTEQYTFSLTVAGPEATQTVDLPPGTLHIGRQEGNDLRLDHPLISRRHAQIVVTDQTCDLVDLDSANGTNVDGQRLAANTPIRLSPESNITIGPFQLALSQTVVEPVPAPPPREQVPLQHDPTEIWPPAAPPPFPPAAPPVPPDDENLPPGLSIRSSRYLGYLPGIYHTDFMARFLAIFESIMVPIEWNVDNFDLYLNPNTTPPGFLPWLAKWFSITFDPSWSVEQQRELLAEAHQIFARRGTRWALSRVLEIYTGQPPEIADLQEDDEPFVFQVKLRLTTEEVDRALIERIIDANKPAHTSYKLLFKRAKKKR